MCYDISGRDWDLREDAIGHASKKGKKMSVFEIFTLLGGVGLFLYGMTIMSSGLRNACGDKLRVILEKATSNKFMAVLAGLAVTIFVQSSSATDVMVIGFVTSGLMTLMQAIGVIMGANIGTTVTAQITAFNISAYAPLILFAGAVISLFVKNKTVKYSGSVILGFGMLFQGIALMKSAIVPLSETKAFVSFVSSLEHPILTVILGILFTALLQSSSSATVIFQAFAVQGIISYQIAVYLVIGAAVGSVAPNLLAGLTANRAGKRCAVLNLIFNTIRAIFILTLITIFPQILTAIQSLSPGNVARQIANTHTIFALIAVAVMLPVSHLIVKLAEKVIPITPEELKKAEEQRLVYLTMTDRVPPPIVIDQAHREITRMGRIAVDNLSQSLNCFFSGNRDLRDDVEETEQTVDFLTGAIMGKLTELRSFDLTERNLNRLYSMIQAVDDFERISDHAENIIEYQQMIDEGEAKISELEMAELKVLGDLAVKSLELSLKIFDEECFEKVFDAEIIEDRVDETQKRIMKNHVERLMHENCDAQGSVIFTDMCTDLERCSDHAINIATALASSAA